MSAGDLPLPSDTCPTCGATRQQGAARAISVRLGALSIAMFGHVATDADDALTAIEIGLARLAASGRLEPPAVLHERVRSLVEARLRDLNAYTITEQEIRDARDAALEARHYRALVHADDALDPKVSETTRWHARAIVADDINRSTRIAGEVEVDA